jgi:hypothetical protein
MRLGWFARTVVAALIFLPHTTLAQLDQSPTLWRFALAGGWGWESNVALRAAPYMGDAATIAMAEATGSKRYASSQVAFTASGMLWQYRSLRSLDRFSYEVRGLAERRFSPRWNGFIRGSALMSLSSEITANEEQLLLPLVISRVQAVAVGSAYRISPLTSAFAEGRFTHATFDAPGFNAASSIGGRMGVVHRYDPRSDYGVTYVLDEYAETPPKAYVQTITADWSPRSARIAARLHAGASTIGTSMGTVGRVIATGSAGLEASLANGISYIRAGRFAGQSLGLGRVLITNNLAAGYDRNAVRGTRAALSADRAWSQDPGTPGRFTVTTDLSARIAKQFATGLTIGAETFLQHRDENGSVSNRGVRMVLGYAIGSSRAK